MPKKKFAFKRKAKKEKPQAEPPSQQPAQQNQDQAAQNSVSSLVDQGNHLLIKDLSSVDRILKTAAEYEGKENVIIENISDCTVLLPFSIKCLYVKNI